MKKIKYDKVLSSKADKGTVEAKVEAKTRRQAIKKVKEQSKSWKYFIYLEWDSIWNILIFGIFGLKVASSHADFFVFESFRRNCPALVVKSAILKLKNKKQWLTKRLFWTWRIMRFKYIFSFETFFPNIHNTRMS